MKFAVVGAGAWGTTLASILAPKGETWLWAREDEVVDAIKDRRTNSLFLDGFELPPELRVTGDLGTALDGAEVVIVAVPSQHVRSTMIAARAAVMPRATIVSAAKGIEVATRSRMSQVLGEVLRDGDVSAIGILSGPNLAREVMAGHPSATCVAFAEPEPAYAVQSALMSGALRVYTSDDVVGCEIGGAAKNVIAIAAGVADGLGYGLNTKAALVTRGLAELTRLGVALGGRPMTFLGLAGNGDLVATCTSPLSRNRRVGEALARGGTLGAVTGGDGPVAEGVETAPAVLAMAREVGVELPIVAAVVAVLRGDVGPRDVVARLMERSPRAELDGLDGLGQQGCGPWKR
jgi:glycerol-3-phosphate dehydrogenase (NAD(P)+)